MDSASYLKRKQVLWALRRGLDLQGSAGERGEPAYTRRLEENLFEPLSNEARGEFEEGDGDEVGGTPCKMQAVHSSAALTVNLFHYWRNRDHIGPILHACGLPTEGAESIRFERKLPITNPVDRRVFPHDPNLDVVVAYGVQNRLKAVGIECKFTETFRRHQGLKSAYLEHPQLWADLPNSRSLARRIEDEDREFDSLHAAQLLKHILGLKHAYGLPGFRLLYLWCDVPGKAGVDHEEEVQRFSQCVRQDGVHFQATTCQEVILNLAGQNRNNHGDCVDYLVERYL